MDDNSAWDSLMAAAQSGDQRAYRQLLTSLTPWLRRYFSRRAAPSVVDDLVQETLLGIHRKRDSYDPAQPFGPWLAAVARYKWIDWLRKQSSHAEVELPETLVATDNGESGGERDYEARQSLESLLSAVTPAQAQVIRLVKIEGRSVEEASLETGQSPSLVKVNIHRGVKRMMKLLQSTPDL